MTFMGTLIPLWNTISLMRTLHGCGGHSSVLQGCGTATTPSVPPLPADATEPTLSILLPLDAELREPPRAAIPLLCHLYDAPKGWDTVRWHHGNVSPVTATSMDGRGVLSAWSLTWLTAEQWDGTVGCTAVQSSTGRTITVTIRQPSSTAQCLQWLPVVLLPSVLTIAVQLMLQLCRKTHTGGPGAPQPPQQCRHPRPSHRAAGWSQETEYAMVALRAPSPRVQ